MNTYNFEINGIKVDALINPAFSSFCLGLFVRAGSKFENENNNGITHLLEHVIFRNLKKIYGENFYELMAANGVDIDACTYKEFLHLSVSAPSYSFEFASDLFCKLFDEIKIRSDEFQKEKARIKAEFRERDEKHTLDYAFSKAIWKDTCIEKTILGSSGNVSRISLKKLNEYRNTIFSADNVCVVLTGNVSDGGIESLKNKLGSVKLNPQKMCFNNCVGNAEYFFCRNGNITVMPSDWCYIKIGFDVETQKYSGVVHDLLYSILFKGDKALIHNSLSEDNPLIYSYDATYEQYDDVSNLSVKFEVAQENMLEAFEHLIKSFNRLKSGDFNFDANYKYELSSCVFAADNPSNLNWDLGYYNFILKTDAFDYNDERFGRLNGVNKDAVIKAAKDIFKRNNVTVAIKGNKRRINIGDVENVLELLDNQFVSGCHLKQ